MKRNIDVNVVRIKNIMITIVKIEFVDNQLHPKEFLHRVILQL